MKKSKEYATLSVDLDNLWTYLKTHGDGEWRRFPSFLETAVPRALATLAGQSLQATFFVVGKDATLPRLRSTLAAVVAAGHEVGNHSFWHDPWLHRYTPAETEREIATAEAAVYEATTCRPTGFRAPGHNLTFEVLSVLARRGYSYDASTWPTVVTPLVRAYYFSTADFTAEQKRERRSMGGAAREARRPLGAYRWKTDGTDFLELPVTALPLARLPIHMTYLHALGGGSASLALAYLKFSLILCRRRRVAPSFLLHATDFIGRDDCDGLGFLPGMKTTADAKLRLTERAIAMLSGMFEVIPLRTCARLLENRSLPVHRL